MTAPLRISIRNGTVPLMYGVPGFRSCASTSIISVSAALITQVPAIDDGPVAPTCGAAWGHTGRPRSADRKSFSRVSRLNSSGETELR